MRPIDQFLTNQKKILDDIDKHCKSKRLKKNIYRLEGIKRADGPIDRHFRLKNGTLITDFMTHEAERILKSKGFNTKNVYEKEFTKVQKLENYEDYFATRRTSATSDLMLNKRKSGTAAEESEKVSQEMRSKLLENLSFIKTNNCSIDDFRNQFKSEFQNFTRTIEKK